MNAIDKDELFGQVTQFLKTKGIDLQEGPYAKTIQKGCGVLADTINLSHQALGRARSQVEKELDHVRRVIHEKTAPKSNPPPRARTDAQNSALKGAKPKRRGTVRRPLPRRPKTNSTAKPGQP